MSGIEYLMLSGKYLFATWIWRKI